MVIGIIGAMTEEVIEIEKLMKNIKEELYNDKKFIIGNILNHNIILTKSGVGKVNASYTTTVLIEKYNPELIINTGSAGALLDFLNIGDVVIGTEISQHDLTTGPYNPRGVLENLPLFIEPNGKYLDLMDLALINLEFKHYFGGIVTGDQFINSSESRVDISSYFEGAMCCEMEAGAIAQVCLYTKKDFVIIRSISDKASSDSGIDFKEYIKLASLNSALMVNEFLKLI